MQQQLIILCGIPFSGKSVLANKISEMLGYTRIDLDEIKFRQFGTSITDDKIDQKGWDNIYQEMYHQIEQALVEGKGVVHDTGNFTVYERGLINGIAKRHAIPFQTVFVDIPVTIASRRLEKNRKSKDRFDISDESFQSAVDEMEEPTLDENPKRFSLPDINTVEDWIVKNVKI